MDSRLRGNDMEFIQEVFMRRITLICLALPCVLLGLNGLAAAQNVSIELTPITYPIVLPDSGGTFDYLLFVTNQDSTPIAATVWCMVTLPNGGSWGPVAGPFTQILAAGQTIGYYRTQSVPPRAPYGLYNFNAYIGIYPNTIWDLDNFPFEKTLAGFELWVARYNGPGNYYDVANAMAVDGGGNVYVTGRSYGSGNSEDYATIKYNSAGVEQWVARYDGPINYPDQANCVAVDEAGNVFVTGSSSDGSIYDYDFDYATVKYNSAGEEQWVARYEGTEGEYDRAYFVAVDGDGSIYVTGDSYGSGTRHDYATVKYNSAGVEQWVARYDGPGNWDDYAYSLALDGNGNIYVTGGSDGGGTQMDFCTIKYNSAGTELWIARYNGPGNWDDGASSLALDQDGNVYVTGGCCGIGLNRDYATVKYNSEGVQQWAAQYDGPVNSWDFANALALGKRGSVYVTGQSIGANYDNNYATVKYDSAGVQQWVARYDGSGVNDDIAHAIAADGDGNVYVTGECSVGGIFMNDYATIKYNSEGVEQWVVLYNGPGNYDDRAYSLAMDATGNVYVTGASDGSGTDVDYATIKYSGGNIANWMPVEATVLGQPLPQEFALQQNYPNPFNGKTVARFELRVPSIVSLRIYDTAGRLVETLVDGWRAAGAHELTWDAGNLPSGMYVYRIQAGEWTESGKMVLVK